MKILAYSKRNTSGEPYRVTVPQISERCTDCAKFIRFTPQTDDVLKLFNDHFESVVIHAESEKEQPKKERGLFDP
jgi:thioredoxin-related protein